MDYSVNIADFKKGAACCSGQSIDWLESWLICCFDSHLSLLSSFLVCKMRRDISALQAVSMVRQDWYVLHTMTAC